MNHCNENKSREDSINKVEENAITKAVIVRPKKGIEFDFCLLVLLTEKFLLISLGKLPWVRAFEFKRAKREREGKKNSFLLFHTPNFSAIRHPFRLLSHLEYSDSGYK